MENINNPAPVESKKVVEKVKVHAPELRPLPEVDRNELHCVMQPVYPGDQVVIQNPVNMQHAPGTGTDQVLVPQGNAGLVQDNGYVTKEIKIKEKIEEPQVM